MCCLQETHGKQIGGGRLKIREWKNIYNENIGKNVRVAMVHYLLCITTYSMLCYCLLYCRVKSDKLDSRAKKITGNKKDHHVR